MDVKLSMFALTHIYAAEKINPKADELFLYGSTFPDIGITGLVGWDVMAAKTVMFSKYLKKENPKLVSFADGLLVHEEPYGIDRFVHGKKHDGYAYSKGKNILPQVKNIFPNQKGLDILISCHNIIEFSVDYRIVGENENLGIEMSKVISIGKSMEDEIAKSFSKYFNIDLKTTKAGIKKYNEFLNYDISNRLKAISFFQYLTKISRGVVLNERQISDILDTAIKQTPDYEEYLEDIIKICKKDYISK